jgi:hypothetical protein
MTTGRRICDALKDIRKTVGESEGINLNQSECHHKGECLGTCPKCEAELREINSKVSHNRLLAIGTATLAAMSLSACGPVSSDLSGDTEIATNSSTSDKSTVTSKQDQEAVKEKETTESKTQSTDTTEKSTDLTDTETSEVTSETSNYYELSGDIAGTLTNEELGYTGTVPSTETEEESSIEESTTEPELVEYDLVGFQ